MLSLLEKLGFVTGLCVIAFTTMCFVSALHTYKHLPMNTCAHSAMLGCVCKGPLNNNDLAQLAAEYDRCSK